MLNTIQFGAGKVARRGSSSKIPIALQDLANDPKTEKNKPEVLNAN